MARLKLGKIRPVNRGIYDNSSSYEAYDYVLLNGSAWLALKDVPAGLEPELNPDFWVFFGGKGEQGEKGETGDSLTNAVIDANGHLILTIG